MMMIKVIKINKRKLGLYIFLFILIMATVFGLKIRGNRVKESEDFPNKAINEIGDSFVLEPGVIISENIPNEEDLLNIDVTTTIKTEEPTVLIIHTHISEGYAEGGTVKEVGERLAKILANDYGINVVHDTNVYDVVDGENTVSGAYGRMEESVAEILNKYPTIKVVIDLHRDYLASEEKILSYVNNEVMAPLMLVNGVCCAKDSPYNPYIKENLALTLQVYNYAEDNYAGLFRKNYVKPYRYSTHFKPLSLLVEVGFQNNTLDEALLSMEPLADTLVKCIESK